MSLGKKPGFIVGCQHRRGKVKEWLHTGNASWNQRSRAHSAVCLPHCGTDSPAGFGPAGFSTRPAGHSFYTGPLQVTSPVPVRFLLHLEESTIGDARRGRRKRTHGGRAGSPRRGFTLRGSRPETLSGLPGAAPTVPRTASPQADRPPGSAVWRPQRWPGACGLGGGHGSRWGASESRQRHPKELSWHETLPDPSRKKPCCHPSYGPPAPSAGCRPSAA